ncbi:hypothetical protein CEP54_010908 [Fusarium duplospermum]|uniref:C2H2-type domain-containing protein n=1 Tax=Fusarium duplospermum TaxID=1325734 RepID=A0A428PHG8_9HYPO|nr:hypothetical protein CEP54_010908 [Fusarium duplospermum]
MGICAVHEPHVATLPRPSIIRENLSNVIGKPSNDHQQRLEQIEWRDETEDIPSSITLGNVATKPTNKAFIPSYTGTVVLNENDYKLCSNVIAFIAVQLFGCIISAAYSGAFGDPKPSIDSPCQNDGADVDVDKQVSTCAVYDPHVYGYKRQSTGGGGGSGPKKQRSDNQGGSSNNYNNAPPGDSGVFNGSGGHGGHDDNGAGSNENTDTQNPDASAEKRFACPFHKLDPVLHAACEPIRLTTWDRVLQHILRAHVLQKHYCPICRTQFKGSTAEREKNDHIRSQCQPVGMMESGYIFHQIDHTNLRFETDYENLKGLPRGSDEEKWFKAWEKLFPGVPLPASPLFESIVDILRRNARGVLHGVPEPDRSIFYNAIFNLPTVASRRASQVLAPPTSTPALASNPAGMTTPTMTSGLSPGQIAAPGPGSAPPSSFSAPTSSRRPQVPPTNSVPSQAINIPTVRRRPAQAQMNPSGLQYGTNPTAVRGINMPTNLQVGQGQPSGGRAMHAPASPHPSAQAHMSPSAGYGPHGMAGRMIPALPDPFLLYPPGPVGQNSVTEQDPIAQQNPVTQNSFDDLSNIDPHMWSAPMPMQDMFGNPIWDLGNENIFATPQMGTSPSIDENENEDELNDTSVFGNGSGSGYPDPGSGFI